MLSIVTMSLRQFGRAYFATHLLQKKFVTLPSSSWACGDRSMAQAYTKPTAWAELGLALVGLVVGLAWLGFEIQHITTLGPSNHLSTVRMLHE